MAQGGVLVPSSTNINCNIFNLWYYDRDSWSGDEGEWNFPKGSSFVYGSIFDGTEFQTLVVLETPTCEWVVKIIEVNFIILARLCVDVR